MTDVDSDIVEDMKNNPQTDETDDSCVLRLIEIVPLDRTSDDDHKPEFIDPVVEVKPEDLQDVKQEPADDYNTDDYKPGFIPRVVEVKPEDLQDVKQELADDYKPEFIYPVVDVKPEDLQDVKQEPADDYNTEDPCFTIQVRSASTCSTLCCGRMICFFQCWTFLPLDIFPWTFRWPRQFPSTPGIFPPAIKLTLTMGVLTIIDP